jgi:hypothetical protein
VNSHRCRCGDDGANGKLPMAASLSSTTRVHIMSVVLRLTMTLLGARCQLHMPELGHIALIAAQANEMI